MNQTEYVIGQKIRYVPASETLSLVSRPEDLVVLTPACNRLLLHLLSSQGTVLSRDTIFSVLWEQYGYSPSNNSLNTYISLIRKAFINLGITDDVVVTIPKVGFIFSPDISVEATHIYSEPECADDAKENNIYQSFDTVTETQHETDDKKTQLAPISLNNISPVVKQKRLRLNTSLVLVSVALIVSLIIFMSYPRAPLIAEIKPVSVGQLNGCALYYLPMHVGGSIMLSNNEISSIIHASNFRCQTGDDFYFYADDNVRTGHSGMIYVTSCQTRDGRMTACRNYMNHHFILNSTPRP
ncbi:winged helix-turn-helix domain-containing protein [Citrobacter braakii]|uniref:winged helix-turn-helix domain-containing protein n=1 Tax=Citrobacter braakii TaxID=57706 RepID=UPI001904FA0F|nr:winged helix-turn-helix domain-containing protein [Citrobacter braakii]ELK6843049.1 winged helix-turn-helix domain-containing protein [Citrobacter braakii]MBJ9573330.1 winged helix-turn-helix domain-containing protein [Citrobacter braakii]